VAKVRYSVAELHRLWASGASYDEIAAALGCASSYIVRLRERHKLPPRNIPVVRRQPRADPTPEELEQRKAEIRAKHMAKMRSESEEQTRSRVWQENKRLGIQEAI